MPDDTPYEFDYSKAVHLPERKKRRRQSLITGKETALNEESELQVACITHYDKRCRIDTNLRENTRIFAVSPNDGYRSVNQRSLAKRMGQRSGVWDLHLFDRRSGKLTYTWIELKSLTGRLSDEQEKWEQFFYGTPVKFHVVKSLNQFIQILEGR